MIKNGPQDFASYQAKLKKKGFDFDFSIIQPSIEAALADYKLSKLVGEGGYGIVLKARVKATKEEVAVKLVPDVLNSHFHLRSIIREITILRQLRAMMKEGAYPHFVELLDVKLYYEPENGSVSCALIMKYGGKAMDRVFGRGEVNAEERHIVQLAYNVLCGLKFLHSADIMHRDIKPGNVLVSKGCNTRICDFGISRTIRTAESDREESKIQTEKLSRTSRSPSRKSPSRRKSEPIENRALSPHVTTRHYRPPEVILICPHYKEVIDIWSLGASLIEIINSLIGSAAVIQPFAGSHCFPLSPSKNEKLLVEGDQLTVILNVLGKLTPEDTKYLTRKQLKYVEALMPDELKINFKYEYPNLDPGFWDLFAGMMEFNPDRRKTASELLKNELFDKVRLADKEKEAPRQIEVSIDADELDYQTKKAKSRTAAEYAGILAEEIRLLRA